MSNVTVQEALKAALAAIDLYDYTMTVEESEKFAKAERLCKAALAEIDKCEPVGLVESAKFANGIGNFANIFNGAKVNDGDLLYTSPQPIEKCEPVAWIVSDGFSKTLVTDKEHLKTAQRFNWEIIPLYTSPQPRDWVGLSENSLSKLASTYYPSSYALTMAVEAKLKELNT